MNRLMALFSFLLITAMAYGQIAVTVTGTVADVDGNGITNIDVNIIVDSTQVVDFHYYNTVTTNEDGFYSDTFEVPSELTQGVVYVWIENCGNAFLYEQGSWHPGGSPVIDFSYCNINCSVEIVDTIGGVLNSLPTGEAPFAYSWSTGETTPNITPPTAGTYCLTVIDNVNCVSSICYDFGDECDGYVHISQDGTQLTAYTNILNNINFIWSTGANAQSITVEDDGAYCVSLAYGNGCIAESCYYYYTDTTTFDSCYVYIDLVQGGAWLQATAGGVAPFTYEWSNGNTSNAIEITEDTLYCVTIVDALGCSSFSCYNAFDLPLSIYGSIIYENGEDSLVANGVVDLFSINGNEAIFVTSIAASNYYRFDNVEDGNYIVRAVVDGYLPTYHLNSMWWNEADIITPVSVNNNQWFHIELIGVDGLVAGPGGITGTVAEPDGFGGQDDDSRSFEAIEGAEIILFNNQNEPIAYAFSNTDGAYAFDNLAYGTYTVYIEVVGYEQAFYTITLGEDNEIANNVNFIVDINNTTITTATKEVILNENLLSIFPNPVKASLNMSLNIQLKTNAMVEVINITGQTIFSDTYSPYEQQKSLDVAALNTGLYLLKITTEEGIIVQQFVKQ